MSEKFSAKIKIQKNFWELGSQDPILFPPLLDTHTHIFAASLVTHTYVLGVRQSLWTLEDFLTFEGFLGHTHLKKNKTF